MTWNPPAPDFDEATLKAMLEEARTEMDMPGLRAAVRLPDGRIVRAAVGLADVERDIPLDDTVGMPGGSTGKTFVAALTMLLVEDRTLSLDDPASKWLADTDWYPKLPNADQIRVRHLLAHTAGLKDYPESTRFQMTFFWRAMRHGSVKFSPEELIGYGKGREPLFPVGEGYHYTDIGYLVLGRLIEAATDRSYFDLLEERILTPHHLDEVQPARESVLTNITPGYSRGVRNLKRDGRMKFDPTSEWTGGGLALNPTMLVQFFAALAEGRVVAPESFTQMLEAGWHDPEPTVARYGLGLFVYNGGISFGNAGLWPGYRTNVEHYMASGITVAVQTNRDGRLNMGALLDRIAALAGAA